MTKELFNVLFSIIIVLIALGLAWYWYDGKLALILVLMLWSNNVSQDIANQSK